MAEMINLGREYDPCCVPCPPCDSDEKKSKKKISYPCLYVTGLSLPTGEFTATIKGRVVGCREPSNGESSCEIEVHEMSKPSGGGLKEALDGLAKKKYDEEEDEE